MLNNQIIDHGQIEKHVELSFGRDAIWHASASIGNDVYSFVLDWSKYSLTLKNTLLAQRLLVIFWSDYLSFYPLKMPENACRKYNSLLRILLLMEEIFPGKSSFELEKDDWIKILVISLRRRWNEVSADTRVLLESPQPLSYQVLDRTLSSIREWYFAFHNGDIEEGPEFNLKFSEIKSYLCKELESFGVEYSEWREGNSFGSIEFTVANLLLSDAITTLNSLKTKQLLAYFSYLRESDNYEHLVGFWDTSPACQVGIYRSSGDASIFSQTISGRQNENRGNLAKVKIAIPLHQKLIGLTPEGETYNFPWKTYSDLNQHYNMVRTAIYIIFLSIMGKRGPSEILTLRGVDITPSDISKGKNAIMRPSILKTNKGVRVEQGVTNFIDIAFDVILQLGYSYKKGTYLPLFSSLPSIRNARAEPKVVSKTQLSRWLSGYYDDFCKRMSSILTFEIKEIHSNISSHQFRHSFAEFALRRFDGNVEELIRQHFCHKYNHWWTKRYTADKLDKDYELALSRKYINELVPRILADSDIDPDFCGGMALYIKRNLSEKIKLIAPEEAENYIEEISGDILQLTPHEYGWCLLHKNYRGVAQCSDGKGSPNPSDTNSQKCNRCANFCASRKSHLEVQKQIAINHIDFIETGTWKLNRFKQASIEAVRNAQALFPELLELGKV